jgi:membrane protein
MEEFAFGITHQKKPGVLSIGLLLTLWSSSNIFSSLSDGLNVVYDTKETRSWLKRKAISLGLLVAGLFLLISSAAILVAGPAIGRALHLGIIWTIVSFFLPFVLLLGMLWLTYYILPNRSQRHCKRHVLIGAVVGAALWLVISVGFRLYVSNFGHYDKTYGVLGGVIVLLLWLDLTALSMLLGGEVASVLEGASTKEEDEALRYAA